MRDCSLTQIGQHNSEKRTTGPNVRLKERAIEERPRDESLSDRHRRTNAAMLVGGVTAVKVGEPILDPSTTEGCPILRGFCEGWEARTRGTRSNPTFVRLRVLGGSLPFIELILRRRKRIPLL